MVRAGFSAFEVRKDGDAEAFAAAMREFTLSYQPSGPHFPLFRARMP
jgi:uncharacterized protein (DUF934 family)